MDYRLLVLDLLSGKSETCIVDPKLVERKDKLLAQAEENLHRENLNPVEEATILAQGGKSALCCHAPHLPVLAFPDDEFDPAGGNLLAEADRRCAWP